jgi:hypothetical protein
MNDRLTRYPARLGAVAFAAALAIGACTNGAGSTAVPASPSGTPMMHESPSPSAMIEHSAAPSASDAMMHESPSPTAP